MREILFSGKTKKGEWIEGYYIVIANKHYIYSIEDTIYYEVIPETIGQCTKMLDKNDKNIYENNIVKINDSVYVCFWDDCNFEYGFKNDKESFGIAYVSPDEVEIIGSITDISELLKGGANNA